MAELSLFLGLSFLALILLMGIQIRHSKLKPGLIYGLFAFGVWLSTPFIIVEHMGEHLKYYIMVLAFMLIEMTAVAVEHRWKYLHHLIHHNVKRLRILSYLMIGAGFAYSELTFYVLTTHDPLRIVLASLPFKALFAVFTHTVLTSSTAVINATESALEHAMLFLLNYLRLVFISVSHYLYLFITESRLAVWLIPFVIVNILLFFRHKKYLEDKVEYYL